MTLGIFNFFKYKLWLVPLSQGKEEKKKLKGENKNSLSIMIPLYPIFSQTFCSHSQTLTAFTAGLAGPGLGATPLVFLPLSSGKSPCNAVQELPYGACSTLTILKTKRQDF